MPLTWEEYGCLTNFSVLYSGGLDSAAVPLLLGQVIPGDIHLLTYKHRYGSLFNEWSRRHNADLRRVLGDRVHHHLVDHTRLWNELGARRPLREAMKYGGHWIVCLGCQQTMATHTIIYDLLHNVTNAFICSSVGGEYAVMSMPITREKNIAFYKRFGIRYNAPLLDLGINKDEERAILRSHGIEPGWGKRRSHQGYQPICLIGFQHVLDITVDWHTTYRPDQVARYLDDKFEVMERLIRDTLAAAGHDPDELIARNKEQYDREQAAIDALRARRGQQADAPRTTNPDRGDAR